MLTKKYPSTTRIVGIVLRSYIPNSGERKIKKLLTVEENGHIIANIKKEHMNQAMALTDV